MLTTSKILITSIGLGLLLGVTPNALAQTPAKPSQFRHIEQPLPVKVGVTLGGLALIGAELWWFLFSKTKTPQQLGSYGFHCGMNMFRGVVEVENRTAINQN